MRAFLLSLPILLMLPSIGSAQSYPAKPVALLAGFAAGESGDTAARIIGKYVATFLGQPVNVENAPGDAGVVAMATLLKAAPDGYTLAMCGMDSLTLRPHMASTPPLSPRQYTAVATVVESPICLAVLADSPFKTTKDFLAEADKRPDALTVGDAGQGSTTQLVALLFTSKTQKKWKFAHFATAAESARALAEGKVDALVQDAAAVLPLVREGKVRALGVFTERPVACLPGVATIREQGLSVVFTDYLAVLGPNAMPPATMATLDAALKAALADPACARALREAGLEPCYEGPAFIASRLRRDFENNAIFSDVLKEN